MKRRIEQQKAAIGKEYKEVSDELIMLEEQHDKLQAEIKRLKEANASEKVIAEKVLDLGVLEMRYRRVMAEYKSK